MKNVNEQNQITNQNQQEIFEPSFQVSVYNEMLDQTSQSLDVIQMIEQQFAQLYHLNVKRSFLLKEISQYLK
jgi:hypothetical protein